VAGVGCLGISIARFVGRQFFLEVSSCRDPVGDTAEPATSARDNVAHGRGHGPLPDEAMRKRMIRA